MLTLCIYEEKTEWSGTDTIESLTVMNGAITPCQSHVSCLLGTLSYDLCGKECVRLFTFLHCIGMQCIMGTFYYFVTIVMQTRL